MRTLRIFGYALSRAIANICQRPLIAALTAFVMTIALLFVGTAHLLEHNLRVLSDEWGAGVQMIVYLDDGIAPHRANQLAEALEKLPAVERVRHVPPEMAFTHLQSALGRHDELLDGIEASFMPASLEVGLVSGVRDVLSAHPVIERLEATKGVEEVEFLGNWVDDFTSLITKVKRAGMWFVAIASLLGIFTVVATMRLSAASRSSELRVLYLMGAPAILLRGPNLIEGALVGLFGAIAATLVLWGIFSAATPLLASALPSSLGTLPLEFLRNKDILQLVVFGGSLGAVGGLLTNYSQDY